MKDNSYNIWKIGRMDIPNTIYDDNKYTISGNVKDYYKEYNWYTKTTREINIWDILKDIVKLIEKDPKNIHMILNVLPEDVIQEYLRDKKLSKIKQKTK
jgi:hypothetical protein